MSAVFKQLQVFSFLVPFSHRKAITNSPAGRFRGGGGGGGEGWRFVTKIVSTFTNLIYMYYSIYTCSTYTGTCSIYT